MPRTRRGERFLPDPGRAFAKSEQQLDAATHGPRWLKDERIAALVAAALQQGENEYHLYELFAWAVMPNHVHAVVRPSRPLPVITRWLKASTARSANTMLGRTGKKFWQSETYDHCIRGTDEFNRIVNYVERNPVRAGLVSEIEAWPWSSAGRRPAFGLRYTTSRDHQLAFVPSGSSIN